MSPPATLAEIQDTARSGKFKAAEEMLRVFFSDLFPLAVASVEIRPDTLSLNSVNGFIHLSAPDTKTGAHTLFFKFHHEENEEGLKEYYNSRLLAENGFPVEMPVYASHEVGRQVLIYPFKSAERMADVCKRLDFPPLTPPASGRGRQSPIHPSPRLRGESEGGVGMRDVLQAQETLDALCCERYLATLHRAPLEKLADEPILQLFYHRLVDDKDKPDGHLSGRHKQFYAQKVFEFPGRNVIRYEDLSGFHWRVNGVEYEHTLGEAFAQALALLSPAAHGDGYPAVVAHGDAHNGNVWFNLSNTLSPPLSLKGEGGAPSVPPLPLQGEGKGGGKPAFLTLFDPAFAGPHIPALLAEIKPTFHNIFAHPLWLYDAQEADARLHISFAVRGDHIEVEHDWQLSALRKRFLDLKRDRLWKPLIGALRERKWLPENWRSYMRSALFCCPTLVMNLRAHAGNARNSHTPATSLLGLSVAMTLASEPVRGHDTVSDFLNELLT